MNLGNTLSGEEILRQQYGTKGIKIQTKIPDFIQRYMESLDFFFIATANKHGNCDCSFRGGTPSVKVIDEKTFIFPDYPGNGAFQSLGNLLENPHIGLLFIDFKYQQRLRINGKGEILKDEKLMEMFPGSIQVVKVTVEQIYKNCSQRIPKMERTLN